LSEAGRRRLAIALARAEETVVDVHVRNVLDVFAAVGDEMPLAHVVDVYLDAMDPPEPRASIIARRVLARGDPAARKGRPTRARRT
jgi:hypothetical protein